MSGPRIKARGNDEIAALRASLSYDPDTGEVLWKSSPRIGIAAGSIAGSSNEDGHMVVTCNGHTYRLHRAVWAMHYGRWPVGLIDHIDRNPSNNRISNLRDTTHTVNQQNRVIARSDSTSGLIGAMWLKTEGRLRARIQFNKRTVVLGKFDTAEEAHEAYMAAKRKFHAVGEAI